MASPPPDESDHWDGFSDRQESDSPSSDSEPEPAHAFLDVEASEAGSDQSSENGAIDSEDEDEDEDEDDDTIASFPQFMQLPAELREMVWKAFCPDLHGEPRIFEIVADDWSLTHRLPNQSVPVRTVLAVHHESRELALKTSPSQIVFHDEQPVIPCDPHRDVVLLNVYGHEDVSDRILGLIDDCLSHFHNLAIHMEPAYYEDWFPTFLGLFTHLDNLFIVEEDDQQLYDKSLAWCVSGKAHEYLVNAEQECPDEPLELTYIWPDVGKYRQDAHREFPSHSLYHVDSDDDDEGIDLDGWDDFGFIDKREPDDERELVAFDYMSRSWVYTITRYRRWARKHFGFELDSPGDPEAGDEETGRRRIGVWPMVVFMFKAGQGRLADLKGREQPWVDWSSSPLTVESEASPDEYESDGIDDGEIDDHSSSDEEDDLPAHLLDGPHFDGLHELLGHPAFGGSQAAQFSSDSEADPGEDGASHASRSDALDNSRGRTARAKRRVVELDSEDEASDEATIEPVGTSRHRPHVIVDEREDEDSGEEEEAPREPARGVKRRARAMLVDSDDEDDEDDEENESPAPTRATKRRARAAVVSDSEDEEEERGREATETSQPPGGVSIVPRNSDDESSDDKQEEEEEEEPSSDDEDEPAPPKRMSLAKRLRMEYGSTRAARPPDDSDDDGDEAEGGDGQGYSGASDDDEGREEEDDGSDGGGMVMGMAGEGEDDGEEEDIDGW